MSEPGSLEIQIGPYTFTRSSYDPRGDVLYLHLADPAAGIEGEETPEGHLVRYDAAGTLAGVTILGARRILDRDGAITITLPQRVEAAVIAPALVQAS
jgi:uncharacterized protein YuzE